MDNVILTLVVYALPVIFAITLHEAAHGYAARHFGDMTAANLGRISLNPARHIDPVGTLLVPVLILAVSNVTMGQGILFGWAKPVPVNFSRCRNPRQDMLWIAGAGPGANLLMALAWGLALKASLLFPEMPFAKALAEMGRAGLLVNASLMLLNLLPILPLDGGRMLVSVLPQRLAWSFARLEPYGLWIILILLATHILDVLLRPLMGGFLRLLKAIYGF
jgi:Zn-dependent protease